MEASRRPSSSFEEAMDVKGAVVQQLSRFPALGGKEDAAGREEPLGGPLLFVQLRLVVIEQPAAVHRLAPSIDGQVETAHLYRAYIDDYQGGRVSDHVHLAQPIDVSVQTLDLVLGIRQPLPRQASLRLVVAGVFVVSHGHRGALAARAPLCGAIRPVGPSRPPPRPLAKCLEVDGDLELMQDDADNRGLGERGSVQGKAEAADLDA
ncbi:hypothetical protein P3342_007181 [Pyrenophora teres f. teres]|nr:hypothetical protein P3342_007181 [Pyrenophora teres f. teres]